MKMTNAQRTLRFLSMTDRKTENEILQSIADSYGISTGDAFDEITTDGAEHLLDYLADPQRAATSVLMRRHGV